MADEDRKYIADHRIIYDPEIDDVRVIRWLPFGDDEAIAERVGRTTMAHSTRGYPRGPPSVDRKRIAIITNRRPTFQVVNQSEATAITDRMCQPTFATRLRDASEDDKKPHCPGPRSGKYDKKPGKSLLKKPTKVFRVRQDSEQSYSPSRRTSASAGSVAPSHRSQSKSAQSKQSFLSMITSASEDRRVTFD